MTSVIGSIKDLITSVFEVIFSTIKTIFEAALSVFHILFTSVISVLGQVFATFKDALGATAGVGKFFASKCVYFKALNLNTWAAKYYSLTCNQGNIFVLAFIGIGIYVYLNKRSRQGRPVRIGNKKMN